MARHTGGPGYDPDCVCGRCMAETRRIIGRGGTPGASGWTARNVGTIDDHEVTFRQGYGENEGHTLIADGQPSGRAFDRRGEHNHYGPKREGGGNVEEDRGHYNGPGH